MFQGNKVFLLDVISNSLGAMLMIFFLVISRHYEKPTDRVLGTLLMMADGDRQRASVGLWVSPPGANDVYFGDEIQLMKWDENRNRYYREARKLAPQEVVNELPSESVFYRRPDVSGAAPFPTFGNATAAVLILDPQAGCWTFGPYYEDDPDTPFRPDIGTAVQLDTWFRGFNTSDWDPRSDLGAPTALQQTSCVQVIEPDTDPAPCC